MGAVDYASLKALAGELGGGVDKLIALSRQNDPFYVGTPADLAQAKWFADLWGQAGFRDGGHPRRLHYWCVSQVGLRQANDKPYENTVGCWQYLCQAGKLARYLGLVGFDEVQDHKNPDPHIYLFPQDGPNATFEVSVPNLGDPDFDINSRHCGGRWASGFNLESVQPYHLEVWAEKSTMDDVLLPVCSRYHANLVTGEGEMSLTAVWNLVKRLRASGKPARVFYISDFDPAGESMPRAVARKVEWMAAYSGVRTEVKLCPLVLTAAQVREYDLPRTPIKESERRGASFEEKHGEGAVELDALEALHPGELGRIVREALGAYWSEEAADAMRERERTLRRAVQAEIDRIVGGYEEELEALESMREELAGLQVPNLSGYEPVAAAPEDVTGDEAGFAWLYDSGREYLEQIAAYKAIGNLRAA